MKIKIKKFIISIFLIIIIGMMPLSGCAKTNGSNTNGENKIVIAEGSYRDSSAIGQINYILDKDNGEKLKIWAKNTGEEDLKIIINRSKESLIKTKEEVELKEIVKKNKQKFTLNISPINGGKTNLEYKITQE